MRTIIDTKLVTRAMRRENVRAKADRRESTQAQLLCDAFIDALDETISALDDDSDKLVLMVDEDTQPDNAVSMPINRNLVG